MVSTLPPAACELATATLARAFHSDPMTRWCIPDDEVYSACFPDFVRAFAGDAFNAQTVHSIANHAGIAIWLAPGATPDYDALATVLQKAMPAPQSLEAESVMEQMSAFHPSEPHWYLPLIGVDPAQQRQQLGSHLMRHMLTICDKQGVPAYLESSNPANIPFYERHGFKRLGEVQAGSSPAVYPMQRPPVA
jgi:ribosomal protein S18 acetylase RimI-like enzyme